MQPLEAGEPRTIGAYRLLGRLGAGGMGRVYLGRSAGGRTVAVKIVHPHFASDEEFRARFRREVAAARRVGGEWTAPVLDADPEAPVPWVATGYVAGPSLDRAVAGYGPLPEHSVRAVGEGLARALVAVHGLGLVHRDVKPSNVMLTLAGGPTGGPRLIDFGIARASDGAAALTSTGVSVGSPGYMSPEQILGNPVTGAADVFSLGAVLVFAATGRPPFSGDNSATLLYKVVHEPPELGAIGFGPLRDLIAACLAKSPADRPAPAVIAAALDGALSVSGWLPTPLVEEANRAAVALLDLDEALPEYPSGPVPFTSSSYGERVAAGDGGTTPYGRRLHGAEVDAGGGAYGADGGVPGPRTASGTDGRRVSVRAAGRRFSCTVVLAAAAVVAVLSGGLYGLGLLPWQSGAARDLATSPPPSSPRAADSAPATGPTTGTDGATPGARDTVPQGLAGTWKGTVTTARLGVSSEFEITISGGRVGQVVARDKSVLPVLGTDCSGDWKLAAATDRSLVLDTTDGPNPAPGVCSDGSADERFTLNANGTLHYRSGDAVAGNPEGDLTRGG
ncbi:serine/threonine-protein kinase [Streptomyces sp. NPDC051577]|uniref:serine/threonine-protein kinase n=1 Tax=Streptomyces sp. NPDC051577 TaxID=3155166 RepID=UPI00341C2B21